MHILNVLWLNHPVSRGDFQKHKARSDKTQKMRDTHRSKIHGKVRGGILSFRNDRSIADNEG